MLAFTSVYFFESGLFNGLQPIQIKKSDFLFQGAPFARQVAGTGSGPPVLRLPPASAIVIRPFRMNTTHFGLWQAFGGCLSSLSRVEHGKSPETDSEHVGAKKSPAQGGPTRGRAAHLGWGANKRAEQSKPAPRGHCSRSGIIFLKKFSAPEFSATPARSSSANLSLPASFRRQSDPAPLSRADQPNVPAIRRNNNCHTVRQARSG